MYEIYAYGNVDSLNGVFNAIAAIIGGASYMDLIRTMALLGFLVALFSGLLSSKGNFHGWNWFFGFLFVYYCAFLPRVQVAIIDRLGAQPPRVVANVPLGIAFFGHVTSKIGDYMTTLFETAFQVIPSATASIPPELTYQQNGVLFGNKLLQGSRQVRIQDAQLHTDMIQFINNCTSYDIADGSITPAAFSQSNDIWPLLGTTNPARFVSLGSPAALLTCPLAYTNLNTRLVPAIASTKALLAFAMNPSLPPATAALRIDGQIDAMYAKHIAGAAMTASQWVRQNAIINLVNEASLIKGQQISDPASIMLATSQSQATASYNMSNSTMGKLAAEALPMFRNVIEAVIYAITPFIFILFMVAVGPGLGLVIKSYVFSLVWIQLWPPLYAILNYVATLKTSQSIQAAASMAAGVRGLALDTASNIYSTSISDQAVAGYLVVSIPIIATAIIKGGEVAFQAVSGAAGIQSAANAAGGATGVGNVSQGQVSLDNLNQGNINKANVSEGTVSRNNSTENMHMANKTDQSHGHVDPHVSSRTNIDGTTQTDLLTEKVRNSANVPVTLVDSKLVSSTGTNLSKQSDDAQQYSQSQTKRSEKALEAGIDDLSSFARAHSDGGSLSDGYAKDAQATKNTVGNNALKIVDNLKKDMQVSDTSAVMSALALDAGAGGSVGVARAGLSVHGQQSGQNQASAAVSTARAALHDMGIDSTTGLLNNLRQSNEFKEMKSSNAEGAARVQQNFSESERFAQSAEASLQQSMKFQQMAQAVKSFGANFTANMGVQWNDFLRGVDPELPNDANRVKEQMSYLPAFLESQGILDDSGHVKNFVPQSEHNPVGGHVTEMSPEQFKESLKLEDHFDTYGNDQREGVITKGHENKAEVGRMQNQANVSADNVVTDPGLKDQVSGGRETNAHLISRNYSDEINQERGGLADEYRKGVELLSVMHKLGNQPDGRSGYQQVRDNLPPPRELGDGDREAIDKAKASNQPVTIEIDSQKKNEIPESTSGVNLPVGKFPDPEVPHRMGGNNLERAPLSPQGPAASPQLPEVKIHPSSPPHFVGPGATQSPEEKPSTQSSIAQQGSLFSVTEAKPNPPSFNMQGPIPDAEKPKAQAFDAVSPPIVEGTAFVEGNPPLLTEPEKHSPDTVVSLAAPHLPPPDSVPPSGLAFEAIGPRVSGPDVPVDGIVALKYGQLRPGESQLKMREAFIAAPEGDPVRSTTSGQVVFAGLLRGYGNLVIVQDHAGHKSQMPFFGNLGEVNVKEGDILRKGDRIGTVGGSYEQGPTGVVFGKYIKGIPVDPLRNGPGPGIVAPRVGRTAPKKKR